MGGDLVYADPRGGSYNYQVAYLEPQLVWGRGLTMEYGGDFDLLFPVCVIGGAFPFRSMFSFEWPTNGEICCGLG